MFSRFHSIMNKMRENKPHVPYDDREMVLKLLHALGWSIWEINVSAIIKSPNYEIIIVVSYSTTSSPQG